MSSNGQDTHGLATVADFIRWGASRFAEAKLVFGHGTETALDDAAALVLYALHLPADLPEVYFRSVLTEMERGTVLALLQRRIDERRPAPYLTNEAWFAGLAFYVDERVLIPRSPIAELIEREFTPWIEPGSVARILDLCTGSGCIAVACAYGFPHAQVDALDISTDALDVARRNVEQHGLASRVRLIQSNLFETLAADRYDIIVSNPPYVSNMEMSKLPREFRYEPTVGLAGGGDGLDAVRVILRQASRCLTQNGILVVEVGDSADAVMQQFPQIPFLWLDFQHGGHGVFLLTAEQLGTCQSELEQSA
ncbi:MAG: 50S ribosomal protein L3 N(5)-glutamine methyltransferase [Gammaproteobacteria bacterium]